MTIEPLIGYDINGNITDRSQAVTWMINETGDPTMTVAYGLFDGQTHIRNLTKDQIYELEPGTFKVRHISTL